MKNEKRGNKRYNAQFASGYAVYMILGSYFEKCRCVNPYAEARLRKEYLKMPAVKQLEHEERLIRWSDRHLGMVKDLHCEVSFRQRNGELQIRFQTGFEEAEAAVNKYGRYMLYVSSRESRRHQAAGMQMRGGRGKSTRERSEDAALPEAA